MPRHCVVPGCKTNYDLQNIRRKDIPLGDNGGVCAEHFTERCFKMESVKSVYIYKDRPSTMTRTLTKPKLKADVIPTIFAEYPTYYQISNDLSVYTN